MDLFEYMRSTNMEKEAPLAARMRPRTLDEVVGQEHIIGKDKLLYRAIKADKISSIIFYGPPGTGKTTVMSGILALFDALKIKTQLAAPTGRASKRLSEVAGREASTIHRRLEAQFDEATGMMSVYHDEEEPLNIDAMIVDETSMVDLQLMMSLLRALKPG